MAAKTSLTRDQADAWGATPVGLTFQSSGLPTAPSLKRDEAARDPVIDLVLPPIPCPGAR
jgi:hypothetical protein